jgi:hypothetical protein
MIGGFLFLNRLIEVDDSLISDRPQACRHDEKTVVFYLMDGYFFI